MFLSTDEAYALYKKIQMRIATDDERIAFDLYLKTSCIDTDSLIKSFKLQYSNETKD